jgi:hypothetical protein
MTQASFEQTYPVAQSAATTQATQVFVAVSQAGVVGSDEQSVVMPQYPRPQTQTCSSLHSMRESPQSSTVRQPTQVSVDVSQKGMLGDEMQSVFV